MANILHEMDSYNPLTRGKTGRTIGDLPDEVLEYIISLTSSYKDLEECKLVCRRWHRSVLSVIRFKKYNLHRAIAENNVRWQHIRPLDMGPTITKRYSHSACCYGNSMFVFGGCTSTSTTFNDLWRLDLTRRQWVRPLSMGSYPSPKACASLVIYRDNLVLFGGWTHPSTYPLHQAWRLFNELHLYSMESNRWLLPCTPTTSPPPTAGHSASVHRDSMVVFGGLQMQEGLGQYANSNDIWVFNLEVPSWRKQAISRGPKPHERYGQSQIQLDEDHLLIIGGCGGPNMVFSDVWLLTMLGPTWTWKELSVRHPERAAAHMWCHPACKVGDNVVVLSQSQGMTWSGSLLNSSRAHGEMRMGTSASQMLRLHTSNIWVPPRAEEVMDDDDPHSRNQRFENSRSNREAQPDRGDFQKREPKNQNGNSFSNGASPPPSSSEQLKPSTSSSAVQSQPPVNENQPSTSNSSSSSSSPESLSNNSPVLKLGASPSSSPVRRSPSSTMERPAYNPILRILSEDRIPMSQPMAAFRTAPSPTAVQGRNRQRQLESLRRMEERICGLSRRPPSAPDEGAAQGLPQPSRAKRPAPPQASPPPPLPPSLRRRPMRTMTLHVLDTSRALDEEDPHVLWLPVQPVVEQSDSNCGPEETILYTLVPGKGELIMFGGIRKDAASVAAHASAGGGMRRNGRGGAQGGGGGDFGAGGPVSSSANIANTVSNTLHFITPPTTII